MSKIIGEETMQLSARVDIKDIERIDKIRGDLAKKTGIEPQRSAVIRMVITMGFAAYEAQKKAEKDAAAAKPAGKEKRS